MEKPADTQHQAADELRVLDRKPEGDPATQRVAHRVNLLVTDLRHDHGHVVAHVVDPNAPIAQGGAAMALEIDGDDLPLLRERGQQRAEHVDRTESAVQQEQRLAVTVDLVVVVDAVRFDVSVRGHRRPPLFIGERRNSTPLSN